MKTPKFICPGCAHPYAHPVGVVLPQCKRCANRTASQKEAAR